MNRLKITLFLLLSFVFFGQKANAQWELFADLLGQLGNTQNNQYFNNLNDLNNNVTIDLSDLNYNLDGLYDAMGNPVPGLDTSGINSGIGDLGDLLQNSGLSDFDQDTILGEIGRLDDLLDMNFDSLNNLFGQYQDSLGTDPEWDVHIVDYDSLVNSSFGVLEDTLDIVFDPDLGSNPGTVVEIIRKLFNDALFADLELAFGTQEADLKYWGDRYSASAKVLRVGTVPRFDGTALYCHDGIIRLPIEPRWHVETSWVSGRIPTSINNGPVQGGSDNLSSPNAGRPIVANRDDNKQFNPLLLSGDFAMMATPVIGKMRNTSFRLITNLGIEFGTYAPAHRDYDPQRTALNRGFATGFGPQVGSGFAASTGPLVIYSMGTITKGDVLKCALPYEYNSVRLEAGIRFGDIINFRYTTGKVTWQENDNRRANINHQFTIGIILSSLHN